jgi:hypothetical protein
LRGIQMSVVTPKSILLDTTKTSIIELNDENGNLIGLMSGGEELVKSGEVLDINKEGTLFETEEEKGTVKCKVHAIQRIKDNPVFKAKYEVALFPMTKTTSFILPLLQFTSFVDVEPLSFVNAFVYCEGYDKDDESVYLLYRFNKHLIDFEYKLMSTPGFIDKEDLHSDYVMYKFRIQGKYKKDYAHFLNSRYSLMSKEAKTKIMKFYGFKEGGTMHGILNRTPEAKKRLEDTLSVRMNGGAPVHLSMEAELYSCIDENMETLIRF